MKSLTIITSIVFFLASCSSKIIPLKGEYPSLPIQIISDKNFDTVWSNLIDLFAQKNVPIKIIDRSSGLIISEPSLLKTTIEMGNGLLDSTAWIVVAKEHISGNPNDLPITGGVYSGIYTKKKTLTVFDVTSDWNVRIKTQGDKTAINVNIGIVKFNAADPSKSFLIKSYRSTGVFEKLISDAIK